MELRVEDLTVEYAAGDYVVRPVDGLRFSADTGSLVVLLGPSGCGKTTLLSCLAGILTPSGGSIHVGAVEVNRLTGADLLAYRRSTVGIVFQAFNLVPSLTATENVAAPLMGAGLPGRHARDRARGLLDRVGLGDRAGHRPGALSGGQQQRVAIARALAHDPPLLLADEPTAHLDYVQVETILRLLRELATPGRVVVVATHDERMLPLADQVVQMEPVTGSEDRLPARRELRAGDVVFEQGSRGDRIYVVEKGRIAIERTRPDGGRDVLATMGPGEHFGEMGPLFGLPRSATARARIGSVVVAYTVRQFGDVVGLERISELLGRSGRPDGAGRPIPTRRAERQPAP